MRRTLALLMTTLTLLAMTAVPVAAAPPLDVTITADETLPANLDGTFTAMGAAVDAELMCDSGTTHNDAIGAPHGAEPVRFLVDKTFTCGSGDTFSLRLHVALYSDGHTTAKWKVTGATGALAGLKGHGTLVGTPVTGGITDVYSGRLK
jgi:hypothetical protein